MHNVNHGEHNRPQMISTVDPFVVQTLQSLMGKHTVIETTRGSVRGTVCDVKPDHVVIEAHHTSFFVRIQEIVWIMPS
ncbi:YuzF family protein [Halalkalibacter akibai]|uniref:DUF2642 domain-containing protein n=1 Tax=Halalkalibacter akibai (strain ATCC 43226 / DSM 21942 / CIP 109018 / JCM 9157 / 1139) TaxID=1236973 RepID=W4QUZ7_HALA3|nr:YuzF family protein [Halalkalibacter akibai]GAE35757.1 hypothetical protein JCM9157_2888 [Halalkalibacter akibai JCM 9157]